MIPNKLKPFCREDWTEEEWDKKYPPKREGQEGWAPKDWFWDSHWIDARQWFVFGDVRAHAIYAIEISIKHPILYLLWFRWWIPSLLYPEERTLYYRYLWWCRKRVGRPYWAEFAVYHPIVFLFWLASERFIQLLTRPIKVIGRLFKS